MAYSSSTSHIWKDSLFILLKYFFYLKLAIGHFIQNQKGKVEYPKDSPTIVKN